MNLDARVLFGFNAGGVTPSIGRSHCLRIVGNAPMAGLAEHCELAHRQVSERSSHFNGCEEAGANFCSLPIAAY